MLRHLELLGRSGMDNIGSGVDTSELTDKLLLFYYDSQTDPEGFLADLRALVADDTGGFVTYGASCLVYDLFSSQLRDGTANEDAFALIDAGVSFKCERGLPGVSFKGYELDRLPKLHRPDCRDIQCGRCL